MLDHALKLKDDKTKFTLIFANVTPADILLKDEFENMKKQHPDRFEPIFVVDKPEGNWSGKVTRGCCEGLHLVIRVTHPYCLYE